MDALNLCVAVGAIEECPVHDGSYVDTMEYSDPEELTQAILDENPEVLERFEDHDEMVERVEEALQSAGEACSSCESNRYS